MNFKIVTASGKEIIPTKIETFNVVQNNRSYAVAHVWYEHSVLGERMMTFFNGEESYLNNRGRYICTHANKDHAAKLVEIVVEEESVELEGVES